MVVSFVVVVMDVVVGVVAVVVVDVVVGASVLVVVAGVDDVKAVVGVVVGVLVDVVVVVVGVLVMVVVIVVDVVMGDSVQLALPVLHPLQLWNGSLSSDRRKHWWLLSRKV